MHAMPITSILLPCYKTFAKPLKLSINCAFYFEIDKIMQVRLFFVKKFRITCILCTPRPIYRSTYRPIVGRCISRYIDWHSTDMSVDISTDTRPIYQPRDVSRLSPSTRPICWSIWRPICRPRVVVWLSADMSIDSLPTFRRYFTDT